MAVSSVLKASVCLTILLILSASTDADVTSGCQKACEGIDEQSFSAACLSKCMEIFEYMHQLDLSNQLPAELEDYEDSTEGLMPEESVRLSRPLQVLSRNDRSLGRSRLLMNKFVRYGRSQLKPQRTRAQNKPNYLRVGRSDEQVSGGDDFEGEAKRASRFVRIGKSGAYEDDAKDSAVQSNQFEVDKKNKRPSKYVRIGKREDGAPKRPSKYVRIGKREDGAPKRPSKYVRIGKREDETSVEGGHQTAEA